MTRIQVIAAWPLNVPTATLTTYIQVLRCGVDWTTEIADRDLGYLPINRTAVSGGSGFLVENSTEAFPRVRERPLLQNGFRYGLQL
jgi:hypothetical protein